MIPVGYMAKRDTKKPPWLKANSVKDIYSVSNCVSNDFANYIIYWRHNGFWCFDSPKIINELGLEQKIDLNETKMFYYEAYEYQYDEDTQEWESFKPDEAFLTNVEIPKYKILEGYDIVTFEDGNCPGHSFLSCNSMAETVKVNEHCLVATFDEAKALLDANIFEHCEPGPSRIFAVYSIIDD